MENRCKIVKIDRLMHQLDSRDHAEGAIAIDLLFFQVCSAFASPERPALCTGRLSRKSQQGACHSLIESAAEL